MHVRELVELAAVVTSHAPTFVCRGITPGESRLDEYWLASRCRLERWGLALRAYHTNIHATKATAAWQAVRPIIEEVLASELLTRVWTAVMTAHDQQHGTSECEPIVRSVLIGHREARNRAMNIMVYGRGFSVEEGVVLNRLRRRVERWTDMLLGRLIQRYDVDSLAFDPQRAREFAADLRFEQKHFPRDHAWNLALASLRATFQTGLSDVAPNADLNQRIANSIWAFFPEEGFDSIGLPKSSWMLRLDGTAQDMEGLINDLWAVDDQPPVPISVRR